MKTLKKQLKLSKNEYYVKHLSIVNVFLPVALTPKEIKVLAAFMSLEGDIAKDRFGTSARKLVMDKLGLVPGGLGNYLKSLKNKKFIDDNMNILPILHPTNGVQNYIFQLVNVTE